MSAQDTVTVATRLLTEDERATAESQMVRMLAIRAKLSARTSFVGYGMQAVMMYDQVDPKVLVIWLACLIGMESINAISSNKLRLHAHHPKQRERLVNLLAVGLFGTGALWSYCVMLPGALESERLFQFNSFCLAIVAIMSVHNLCFAPRCLNAFTGGLCVFFAVACITRPDQQHVMLGLGAVALTVLVHIYAHNTHRLYASDIRGRIVTESMATELRCTNEDLNLALEKIRKMASLDPLTQCLNRRAQMDLLEAELARQQRHGTSFGVIMFDLDHFKSINDRYGHGVGDAVLVAAAERLRAQLRPTDSLARWGGEEFLCLFSYLEPDGLLAKAELLRAALADKPLLHMPETITVTASIGAAMHRPGQSVHDVIEVADAALYRAKRGGRNRVCGEEDHDAAAADADNLASRELAPCR